MNALVFGMVMSVGDDVIGDAPLCPSALLSRVFWRDFSLMSIKHDIA
jgi:hypothetical protein